VYLRYGWKRYEEDDVDPRDREVEGVGEGGFGLEWGGDEGSASSRQMGSVWVPVPTGGSGEGV
jgi:hypothetical protein